MGGAKSLLQAFETEQLQCRSVNPLLTDNGLQIYNFLLNDSAWLTFTVEGYLTSNNVIMGYGHAFKLQIKLLPKVTLSVINVEL